MKKLNQKGFGHIEIIMTVLLVAAVGAIGWFIYSKNQNTTKTATITSFEECKAAGNPIMESYPEQCSANGETYTKKYAEKSYLNGKVVFSDLNLTEEEKQTIVDRIAGPIVVYETEVLKSDLTKVAISPAKDPSGPNDFRYILSYNYKSKGYDGSGFVFGENMKIGYWNPQLCEVHGDCSEYPQVLKDKYPASYQAYLKCQAATDKGDKEAFDKLNCMN